LAEAWYDAADAIGLPVTAWAAGPWPASYAMGVYRADRSGTLNIPGPQAPVVASHPTTDGYLRGVVLASGSFGDSAATFSNATPGRYGFDYTYDKPASYAYLAAQGVRLVRLTVLWERIQSTPGGELNTAELARLRAALDSAARVGLRVILDLHNYGSYLQATAAGRQRRILGSAALPSAALADVWFRLAQELRDHPAVLGFDLLNEPTTLAARGPDGARLWEAASQEAVSAIRRAGSAAVVAVTGYGQTSPGAWGDLHPRAWIADPVGRVVYESHAYFDADSSGRYHASYADELAAVGPHGGPRCHRLTRIAKPGRARLAVPAGPVRALAGPVRAPVTIGRPSS
jgi:hypothetical protein